MGKAILHNLVDMLSDTDTETIYNVLIRFVPGVKPYEDETQAIKQAEKEIESGNVEKLSNVEW